PAVDASRPRQRAHVRARDLLLRGRAAGECPAAAAECGKHRVDREWTDHRQARQDERDEDSGSVGLLDLHTHILRMFHYLQLYVSGLPPRVPDETLRAVRGAVLARRRYLSVVSPRLYVSWHRRERAVGSGFPQVRRQAAPGRVRVRRLLPRPGAERGW